jgi:hypothetical protein
MERLAAIGSRIRLGLSLGDGAGNLMVFHLRPCGQLAPGTKNVEINRLMGG